MPQTRLRGAAIALLALAVGLAGRPPAQAQGELAGSWRVWANADDVISLSLEGDVLWAGSRHGGLARWDPSTATYEQFLSPQDPLPGNSVRAVAVDGHGWKWLATDRGLARLADQGTMDRRDDSWMVWTRASTAGSLPTDDLWSVAVDGTTVWVGGLQEQDSTTGDWEGGGLGRLETRGTLDPDDDTWAEVVTFASTFSRTPDGRETLGLVSDSIRGLQSVEGGLWVGTTPHWIWESDPLGTGYWRSVHGGLSFVGTGGTFDPADDDWDAYSCENALREPGGRPVIGCVMGPMAADGVGNVWVAASGLGAVAFAANQRPLLGRTVHRFDDESGLAGSAALTVARAAADDSVWIGLRDAGVVLLKHEGTLADRGDDVFVRFDKAAGLTRNRVQAVAAAGATAWLGTGPDLGVGGGVVGLDSGGDVVQTLQTAAPAGRAPPSNFLTDIAAPADGSAWAGGVWVATGSRKQQRFGTGVALLTPGLTADDDEWRVYTAPGTDGNGTPPYDGLAGNNVHAILIDGPRAWFGAVESLWDARRSTYLDGGLSVLSADEWTARTTGTGLQDGSLSSLALGCDGRVWAGSGVEWSFGRGVDVLTTVQEHNPAADVWEHFSFPQLPSDNVRGIAHQCSGPEAWVAGVHSARGGIWSDGGVSRRDPAGAWTRYDIANGFTSYADGVVTGEATSLALHGSDVWAGAFGTSETTEQDLIATAPYWPAVVNRWHDAEWSATVFPRLGWIADLSVDPVERVWAAASRGGLARAGESADSWIEDGALVGLMVKLGETWVSISGADGLPMPDVSGVYAAENGDVWLASEGWGLARYTERVEATPTPSATATVTVTPVESPSPTATGTGSQTTATPTNPTQETGTVSPTPSEPAPTTPSPSATSTTTPAVPPPTRLFLPSLLVPATR